MSRIKRPAFQFYPGDWLRSTDLRSCSLTARGLWMDMLCLMHEGNPYGYLKVGDKVILPETLARMVGSALKEVLVCLEELKQAGVYSLDEHGCIYSRRMVKDEQTRLKRASGGILGGNPALKKDKAKDESKVNLPANLKPTPASASAFASTSTEVEISDPNNIEEELKKYDPLSLRERTKKFNQKLAEGIIATSQINFDHFRELYPKPGNWQEAQIAWVQKKCDDAAQQIFDDIPKRLAEHANWKQGAKFILNPENYLKREEWKNAIIPEPTNKITNGSAYSGKTIAQLKRERAEREAAEQGLDRPNA